MAVDIIARALGVGASASAQESSEEFAVKLLLLLEEIEDTVQTIQYTNGGQIQSITHTRGAEAIRVDAFTFQDPMITEVRTLNTGETLTISTNTQTLTTTIVYSE